MMGKSTYPARSAAILRRFAFCANLQDSLGAAHGQVEASA